MVDPSKRDSDHGAEEDDVDKDDAQVRVVVLVHALDEAVDAEHRACKCEVTDR